MGKAHNSTLNPGPSLCGKAARILVSAKEEGIGRAELKLLHWRVRKTYQTRFGHGPSCLHRIRSRMAHEHFRHLGRGCAHSGDHLRDRMEDSRHGAPRHACDPGGLSWNRYRSEEHTS